MKQNRKLSNRFLSMLLALVLVFSMIPMTSMTAYAAADTSAYAPTRKENYRKAGNCIFANGTAITIEAAPNGTKVWYMDGSTKKYVTNNGENGEDLSNWNIFVGSANDDGMSGVNGYVTMTGGTVKSILAGQYSGGFRGTSNITVTGGTVTEDIYCNSYLSQNSDKVGTVTIFDAVGTTISTNDGKADNVVQKKDGVWSVTGNGVIPSSVTLTVGSGETLTVPKDATLTNNGSLVNNGTMNLYGPIRGNAFTGNGTVNCYAAYIEDISSVGNISASMNGNTYSLQSGDYYLQNGKLYIWLPSGNAKVALNGIDYYGVTEAGKQTELISTYVGMNNVSISGIPSEIGANVNMTLAAKLTGNTTLTPTISYELASSTAQGATVNGSTLYAAGAGKVTVKVNVSDGYTTKTENFEITVKHTPVTELSADVPESIIVNTKINLPKVLPSDASYQTITWAIISGQSNTGATVNNGVLTATKKGTFIIRATVENGTAYGKSYTKDFTVKVVALDKESSLDITAGSVTISQNADGTLKVEYSGYDGDGYRNFAASDLIVITGETSTNRVVVKSGSPNVVLTDCSITLNGRNSPFEIQSGAMVKLTLSGTNSLCNTYTTSANGSTAAGIYVPSGATLIVEGNGGLNAYSEKYVGIGGAAASVNAGNITINSGTITATSNQYAGIGGYFEGSGGNITINGGTITATGIHGAGIGGGTYGSGGNIIIKGGNVKASSIGAGNKGSGGTLTDGNGNSVSKVTFTLDGMTEATAVTAIEIEGSTYGVNGVSTLDTNKLYFYLPAGANVTSITTESGTYNCKVGNTFYKGHEYSADCDDTCNRCGGHRDVSVTHDYENGICKNCGGHQPAVWNSSKNHYEISNAGQLMWLSCLVNGTLTDGTMQNQSAKAVLMNDIDMSGVTGYTPIGTTGLYYKADGTDKGYSGTFDGNGYAIKNLTITGSGNEQLTYGIFGTLSGKVSRLGVENLNFTKGNADCRAGGIAGQMITGSSVTNCYVVNSKIDADGKVAGGLAGCNYAGTIENCYTYKVTVTASRAGGIVGDNRGDANDNDRKGTITNCYTDASDIQNSQRQGNVNDSTAGMSDTAFTSGEVTYKLNKGVTDGTQVWYQTLEGNEKQDYPNFSGKTVYSSNGQYVNAQIITITGVTSEDGVYNGSAQKGYTGTPTNADGYTGSYEVKYVGRNNTTYSSTEAPTNAGDYTVTISTDSKEAQYIGSVSLDFTIAKKDVTVTAATQKINKGESLSTDKVTVGTLLDGHTATVTAATKGENCKYTATVVIKDGNNNDVTANYSFDATGTYHEYDWDTATHGYKCINCTDIEKTDSDMPTAEYKIGTSGFKKFINTITFGLFCKDYKTVEITSDDATSGVKTTQYYISGKELSETELADVTWNNYTDKLSLNAKGTYFIYVKVTDKAGNVAVYNSEGIVIFEDSTVSVDIEYTRTTNTDVKADIDFNGNTVKGVTYGTSVLKNGTDYTVTDDGITFTAKFLETLAASDNTYTVTVSYNAGGVEWGNDSYGTKAADTVIAITVKLATGSVTNIENVSKTYDGDEVSNPTYTSLSTGNATYEYKVKGADDNTYTTTAPKDAGDYTVRVTVAADTNYKAASATKNFKIKEATLTNINVGQSSDLFYTGKPQTATVATKATAKGGQEVTFTYCDTLDGTYTESVPAFTARGTYIVYYKATADNHNTASGYFSVTIGEGENEWTAAPSITGWTYGETANTPTVAAKFGDVSVTYTGTANDGTPYNNTTAPTKAGTYKAVFTVAATNDYTELTREVPFTIERAKITVTVDNAEKTYGDSEPSTFIWTKTSGTLYNGDTLTGISVTRESGEKAGTYAIKAVASDSSNPNYDIIFVDGTFTINKAVLTVTADNQTATYGDAVPNYTVSYYGFKNGETNDVLGGTLAFDCDYAQFSDKGDYTITPKGLDSDNYTFDYKNGTLSVSAKKITVAIVGKTSVYGDDIATLTATDKDIVNGDKNVYSLSTTASKTASVGFYDITGTALDDNYSITFTGGTNAYEITKRNLTVTVEVYNKQYDGLNTASIKSAELNNVANGDSITLVNGTPTFSSVNVANGIGILFTDFTLQGNADVLKNYHFVQPEGITANITNDWNPAKDTEYITGTPNANGWVKENMIVSAKDGYELSLTNTVDGTWENALTGAVESADSSLTFYVRNKTTGAISEQVTVNYKLDKNSETTGTTGKVEFVGRTGWQNFVNTITFGLFYKDEVTVKAEATDKLSGVASIEYAVSDKALSLEEVKAITDWTAMSENGVGVTVEDEKTFVYFIRITDKAGNVTYLSTNGAEYDTTLPAIEGIENGATYHTTKVITVTDKNLENVTLNSEPVTLGNDGKLTLDGNCDETYIITVTDKAGNVTEYTVTMKAIADITDSIKDITVDDVTSDDKENIETVIKDIEEELKNEDLTDEEKEELEDEKQKAEDLIKKIEEAIGSTETENTDKVKDITPDNVKPEDKKDLEKAKDDYEKALEDYKDNLTDDEKKDIEKEIERIEDALDVIEKVEDVEDLINKLPDTITKGDADAVKKADEAYNALSEYEQSILNKDTKKKLDNSKSALEALNKATTSPATGDNSHIWLWFALLFVSGGGVLGTTAYSKKKRKTE